MNSKKRYSLACPSCRTKLMDCGNCTGVVLHCPHCGASILADIDEKGRMKLSVEPQETYDFKLTAKASN